jgi:RNA polymerase sigma-70 factor (ECF subfamily)
VHRQAPSGGAEEPSHAKSLSPVTEDGRVRAVRDRYAEPLLGYVERLTGDHHRAEDIVQETLLRAWRSAPRAPADQGSLRSWLFRVARNLATDAHRARRARPPEVAIDALDGVPSAERADRSLHAHLLVEALGALREEHRLAIVETYLRGRSVAEAAVALGVPPGTVKSRCYYGLRALRRELERRGLLS